ncbi:hypothetical protein ACSBR1_012197 [Camellia fascicularis]
MNLVLQIKDMALKASRAYQNCNLCTTMTQQHRHNKGYVESSVSEGFRYRRMASLNSSSTTLR